MYNRITQFFLVAVCGAMLFAFGFVCALMSFHSRHTPKMDFVDILDPQSRLEWGQIISHVRAENQHVAATAMESLKITANVGPLYLATNDDFSAFALMKRHAVPIVFDNREYGMEIILYEFPFVSKCSERLIDIQMVARELRYIDQHKTIKLIRFKNDEENFYYGGYTVRTPMGTIRFLDMEGAGVWDVIHDDINGRIFDSIGLCWVERNGTDISCPIHHCPNCGEFISNSNLETRPDAEQIDSDEHIDESPQKE